MKIKKKLNLVELASEMASAMLFNASQQSGILEENLFEEENDGELTTYTEEAQELFNEYYDDIWEYLVNKGFKHVNSGSGVNESLSQSNGGMFPSLNDDKF